MVRALGLLGVVVFATLAGCASTSALVYPDDAWAAGIEGDVVIEECIKPWLIRAVSGPPELADPLVEALNRSVRSQPSDQNCRTLHFAFRKHLTPAEALELASRQDDTMLVTRGFERARKLCGSPPGSFAPGSKMVTGVSKARLVVDETGHVTRVTLLRSVASPHERGWVSWLEACTFAPARLDGRPVASPSTAEVQWDAD
jgi:hypothetical protein